MFCWLVPRHEAEVAAATWTKIRLPRQRVRNDAATSLVERTEVPEHQGPQREKESGWRLWWYASSFMPPQSPAGASHSIHHEVNNRSLCALIRHNVRDQTMRRPSVSTLPWRFAAAVGKTGPQRRKHQDQRHNNSNQRAPTKHPEAQLPLLRNSIQRRLQRNSKRPRFPFRESGRPRLQIQWRSHPRELLSCSSSGALASRPKLWSPYTETPRLMSRWCMWSSHKTAGKCNFATFSNNSPVRIKRRNCRLKPAHRVQKERRNELHWMSQLVPQSCSSSARWNQKRWMIMNVSAIDHVMAKFS